jgi:glutamate carboxypeptidase
MIGHLDTVFTKDDPFQSYTPLNDNRVAGPGITDMKGGDVIIVSVLRALKTLGLLENMSVTVVMTGDEESSGKPLSASKRALIDAAKWADIALGFEDGDSNIKTAVIARRGSVNWTLDVKGRPAHSSQIFSDEIGYGAIFEAARILNAFREELAGVGNLTFNPGVLLAGTTVEYDAQNTSGEAFGKRNVVAQTAKVTGGIRAQTPEELENAKKVMHKIVQENLLHTSATLVIGDGYPPMAPRQPNYDLLSMYSDVSESLGYGKVAAVNPRNAGAADISFTAGYVDMAMDGLGLMGSGGHTKDEVADMTSFAKNMHKAAILMYRLSQQ